MGSFHIRGDPVIGDQASTDAVRRCPVAPVVQLSVRRGVAWRGGSSRAESVSVVSTSVLVRSQSAGCSVAWGCQGESSAPPSLPGRCWLRWVKHVSFLALACCALSLCPLLALVPSFPNSASSRLIVHLGNRLAFLRAVGIPVSAQYTSTSFDSFCPLQAPSQLAA